MVSGKSLFLDYKNMLHLNLVQLLAWSLGSFLLGWGSIAYSLHYGSNGKAKAGFDFYKFFEDFKFTGLFEAIWKLAVKLVKFLTFDNIILEDLSKK